MPTHILWKSIKKICKRDFLIKRIDFTQECFEMISGERCDPNHPPDYDSSSSSSSDDCPEFEANNKLELMTNWPGEREWYCDLGRMIGQLEGLRSIHFHSLDPGQENLERFWGEVVGSRSLMFVEASNMDLTYGQEFLIWFHGTKVKQLSFYLCTIGNDVGYDLVGYNLPSEDEGDDIRRQIVFHECHFPNINKNDSVMDFARGFLDIRGLFSLEFRNCTFQTQEIKRRFELMMSSEFNNPGFNFVFE